MKNGINMIVDLSKVDNIKGIVALKAPEEGIPSILTIKIENDKEITLKGENFFELTKVWPPIKRWEENFVETGSNNTRQVLYVTDSGPKFGTRFDFKNVNAKPGVINVEDHITPNNNTKETPMSVEQYSRMMNRIVEMRKQVDRVSRNVELLLRRDEDE